MRARGFVLYPALLILFAVFFLAIHGFCVLCGLFINSLLLVSCVSSSPVSLSRRASMRLILCLFLCVFVFVVVCISFVSCFLILFAELLFLSLVVSFPSINFGCVV